MGQPKRTALLVKVTRGIAAMVAVSWVRANPMPGNAIEPGIHPRRNHGPRWHPGTFASQARQGERGPEASRGSAPARAGRETDAGWVRDPHRTARSEEHTSELQPPYDLVCRLLR